MTQLRSRTHRRPALRLLAWAAAGGLTLTACSGSDGGDDAGGDGAAGGSTGFSLGVPITEAGESPYKALADRYMEENPDVTVDLQELPNDGFAQALRTQLQAGNAPDVFYVTPGGGNPQALIPFAEAGYLEPLTGTSAEDTIPESNLPQFTVDGEVYGQALDLAVVASVANVTAMEADGFEMPESYGEVLEQCPAVAEKGKSVFVLAGAMPPNTGLAALTLAGPRVYAQDPDWNEQRAAGEVTFAESEGWQSTLQAFIDMNEAGCFQGGVAGGGFAEITNGLAQGTSYVGFAPSGAAFGLGAEAPDSSFVVQPMPAEDPADTTVFASANNALAINADSESIEAAKEFLAWAAEPEQAAAYAEISGNLPIGDLDPAALPEQYAPVADYLAEGNFIPLPSQGWTSGEVYTALGTGVQGLLTGQTTVDAVLQAMDAAWEK